MQKLGKINWTTVAVWSAVCALATCVGCNDNKLKGLKPVEGVVLYEGVPLAWASVSLIPLDAAPGARMASAVTDENGRFEARTLGGRGALPGEYAVAEWEQMRAESGFKEPKPGETTFEVVAAIPLEYSNARENGLTASVPEKGVKDLKFELTKL